MCNHAPCALYQKKFSCTVVKSACVVAPAIARAKGCSRWYRTNWRKRSVRNKIKSSKRVRHPRTLRSNGSLKQNVRKAVRIYFYQRYIQLLQIHRTLLIALNSSDSKYFSYNIIIMANHDVRIIFRLI